MKKQLWLALLACALSLAATLSRPLIAQEASSTNPSGQADNVAATYIVFDSPYAKYSTTVVGINAADTVVGYYYDAAGILRGFYRLADGTVSSFDVPGCDTENDTCTFPTAINSDGTIIGYYNHLSATGNPVHAFIRDPLGNYTKFDPPGSLDTVATAINSAGTVTGYFINAAGVSRGFIRDAEGNLTVFDAPTVDGLPPFTTYPVAINSLGTITGNFEYLDGPTLGFLRESNGTLKVIGPEGLTQVFPLAISDGGKIVGFANDKGFTRDPEGNYTTFSAPEQTLPNPTGIDRAQTTIGYYTTWAPIPNDHHPYFRLASGRIEYFTPFGAGTDPYDGTANAINPDGDITGVFRDSLGEHVYIRVNPDKPPPSSEQDQNTSVDPAQ